ncbi:hypothetical protein [Desulfonauticus submarinus]
MKNKQIYYNIIVLRDDTSLKTFRIKRWVVKFLPILLVFILLYCGISTFFLFKLNKENKKNYALLEEKENELKEIKFELSRLNNVKQLLEKYDETYIKDLVSGIAQNKNKPGLDLEELFGKKNLNLVKISNVQCIRDNKYFLMRFDLNNLEANKESRGRVFITVITRDGKSYDLNLTNEDLKFTISRFKAVQIRFKVPEYIGMNNVFAFKLTVKNNQGKVVFRETYPLDNILL